jgi:hypothetical protein
MIPPMNTVLVLFGVVALLLVAAVMVWCLAAAMRVLLPIGHPAQAMFAKVFDLASRIAGSMQRVLVVLVCLLGMVLLAAMLWIRP